jgi:DNA-binding transcriptional LysR family regulator
MLLVEQARQMMLNAANIERLAGGEGLEPEGVVCLSLPEGLCNEIIVPALGGFQQRYPKLRLILAVSTRAADLIRGEADVALRLYRPKEPGLVVRKLGMMKMGLYASRSYLQRSPPLVTTDDIAHHPCIGYGDELQHLDENQWLLSQCSPERLLLCSDSTSCRLKATLSGLGLSVQPDMIAARHNDLVPLLEHVPIPGHEIWLTYHQDLVRSYRTRLLVDMLVELLAEREI